MDGDIWLWIVFVLVKEGGLGDYFDVDLLFILGVFLCKIDLVLGKFMKMLVILMKWCVSGKGGKDVKDVSG